MCYCEENSVPHVVLNNIECVFKKIGIYSYLFFYERDKNKKILDNHVSIVDQLKKEIWSFVGDECWDEIIIVGKDCMRFKFKTDDELVYNQKINIPVCVILLSCIVKKGDIYYPQFDYKIVFMIFVLLYKFNFLKNRKDLNCKVVKTISCVKYGSSLVLLLLFIDYK